MLPSTARLQFIDDCVRVNADALQSLSPLTAPVLVAVSVAKHRKVAFTAETPPEAIERRASVVQAVAQNDADPETRLMNWFKPETDFVLAWIDLTGRVRVLAHADK